MHLHVTCARVYATEIGNGKALFQHAIRVNSIAGLYGGELLAVEFCNPFFFLYVVTKCPGAL